MKNFSLKIITPEGIYLEKEVTRIDVKTLSGNIGVLANHVPIVSGLEIGLMNIITGDTKDVYALHGGLLNVTKKEVIIITDAIENQKDIDKKRAQIAKEKAQQILSNKSSDENQKNAELALKKALTRLKI